LWILKERINMEDTLIKTSDMMLISFIVWFVGGIIVFLIALFGLTKEIDQAYLTSYICLGLSALSLLFYLIFNRNEKVTDIKNLRYRQVEDYYCLIEEREKKLISRMNDL